MYKILLFEHTVVKLSCAEHRHFFIVFDVSISHFQETESEASTKVHTAPIM